MTGCKEENKLKAQLGRIPVYESAYILQIKEKRS